MIRLALAILVLTILAAATFILAGEPGRASVEWLGWRVDMSAATALVLMAFGALVLTAVWQLLIWLATAPARAARARAEARRRQGMEAISRGFLAAAAGEGSEARRLALKAAELTEDAPALMRLLSATAAEAADDEQAAHAAYTAMLGFPDMRLAGHRGLMLLAERRGDAAAAFAAAEQAYALAKTARWAWRVLFEARLAKTDWSGALALAQSAQDRKVTTPAMAERARAALLAAQAAGAEAHDDPKRRAEALDRALEAAKLCPGFAPGVVMAARLLAQDGKIARATGLIEQAWKAEPHPALGLAYRDLRTDETPGERARRLQHLAGLNPDHRESLFLMVEQALIVGDHIRARTEATRLSHDTPTQRLCALMARVARAAGDADEARSWVVRARAAPQEPDWSDLDPEGRAFNYTPEDWARLVASYAETGALIHPRHERRERVMTDLPDLPLAYQTSAPFVAAASDAAYGPPQPDDPGPYAEPYPHIERTPLGKPGARS
jgi:HemY protein